MVDEVEERNIDTLSLLKIYIYTYHIYMWTKMRRIEGEREMTRRGGGGGSQEGEKKIGAPREIKMLQEAENEK